MDIIVRGEPHEIDFVRRICRDKVLRGVIAILPGTSPVCDDVVKLRNERDETTKENERLKERVAELENQLSNIESNVDTSNSNVDTCNDNFDSVPKIADSVPETDETIENDDEKSEEKPENVPNSPDSVIEPDTTNSDAMDNKYVDPEEFQEVDLDADDKTLTTDDSKDVPEEAAKEAAPSKKTSKRSKKSE